MRPTKLYLAEETDTDRFPIAARSAEAILLAMTDRARWLQMKQQYPELPCALDRANAEPQ